MAASKFPLENSALPSFLNSSTCSAGVCRKNTFKQSSRHKHAEFSQKSVSPFGDPSPRLRSRISARHHRPRRFSCRGPSLPRWPVDPTRRAISCNSNTSRPSRRRNTARTRPNRTSSWTENRTRIRKSPTSRRAGTGRQRISSDANGHRAKTACSRDRNLAVRSAVGRQVPD